MDSSFDDIIDSFNSGDLDVGLMFNDYETFFNILKKRNLFKELDPINGANSSEWQNEYLLYLYDNDGERYNYWIEKILGDIEFENGKPYLVLNTISDLSELFCTGGRHYYSQDFVSNVLSGDHVNEYFDETTDDVYRDVIEELNDKNMKIFYDQIVYELKDQKINTGTERLEIMAQEQNHPEYVLIDSSNVMEIVDDEETMMYILDEYMEGTKSNLYSIHSSSYGSAYENTLWESVWNKLNEYFEGTGEWVQRPHSYKKDVMVETFRVPILDFYGIINNYLEDNKRYGNQGTLEYQGSFLYVLKEYVECLKLYPPDYPDSREVDKNINEFFSDYI